MYGAAATAIRSRRSGSAVSSRNTASMYSSGVSPSVAAWLDCEAPTFKLLADRYIEERDHKRLLYGNRMIPGGLGERLESLRVFGPSGPRPGSGGFARLASLRLAAARLAAGFLHPLLRLLRHWRGGGNILIWIFQIRNGCRRLLIWIFQIRPRGRSGFNRPPGKQRRPAERINRTALIGA